MYVYIYIYIYIDIETFYKAPITLTTHLPCHKQVIESQNYQINTTSRPPVVIVLARIGKTDPSQEK